MLARQILKCMWTVTKLICDEIANIKEVNCLSRNEDISVILLQEYDKNDICSTDMTDLFFKPLCNKTLTSYNDKHFCGKIIKKV